MKERIKKAKAYISKLTLVISFQVPSCSLTARLSVRAQLAPKLQLGRLSPLSPSLFSCFGRLEPSALARIWVPEAKRNFPFAPLWIWIVMPSRSVAFSSFYCGWGSLLFAPNFPFFGGFRGIGGGRGAMAVDARQLLAGFLTMAMFAMLGNMIKRDHFDSVTVIRGNPLRSVIWQVDCRSRVKSCMLLHWFKLVCCHNILGCIQKYRNRFFYNFFFWITMDLNEPDPLFVLWSSALRVRPLHLH